MFFVIETLLEILIFSACKSTGRPSQNSTTSTPLINPNKNYGTVDDEYVNQPEKIQVLRELKLKLELLKLLMNQSILLIVVELAEQVMFFSTKVSFKTFLNDFFLVFFLPETSFGDKLSRNVS